MAAIHAPHGARHVTHDESRIETEKVALPHEQTADEQQISQKVEEILQACQSGDDTTLRRLAASEGGLISDEARQVAWPILLGQRDLSKYDSRDWTKLDRHRDEDQVELDVNRSFVYYPENESRSQLDVRKRELSDLIVSVLRRHPLLCYFQGYHDIIQVFLLVLGAQTADKVIARLSLLHIRDFMLPTLAGAEAHLRLLPAILYAADPELCQHLSGATRPTPFFALAATLTLYAHDIEEYGDIARLFDYLLASEAVVPVYLFAVIVTARKKELLQIEPDEPEMLHSILSKLPKPLDLEGLIQATRSLLTHCPPEALPFQNTTWRQISAYSVLKTTRDFAAYTKQTLQDGERLFEQQAEEIRRQEDRRRLRARVNTLVARYKRPAGLTGAAILVALAALYLGRTPTVTATASWTSWAAVVQERIAQAVLRVSSSRS